MSEKDPEPLSPLDKSSHAYKTVKERIPTTLTQIIDGLHRRDKENWDNRKAMINKLSQLRYEVMTDKRLSPFDPAVAIDDFELWDKAFQLYETKRGKAPTWFTSPWLFWECYVYRCVQLFADTSGMYGFDVFEDSKRNQFNKSIDVIKTLSKYFDSVLSEEDLSVSAQKRKYFDEFLQTCLWGNECDLSMSNMSDKAMEENPLSKLTENKSMIVVDDSDSLWEHLMQELARKVSAGEPAVVTFVLDNAGPELFCDLAFADFLIKAGLASQVNFQGKAIPWFISDVTERDLQWTLETMASSEVCNSMRSLAKHWQRRFKDGTFQYDAHLFWTTPFDYAAMATECPDLYNHLLNSDLLVFKGDLNHRKLVGDLAWPPTATFKRALRGFHPIPLVSLRVCKADVVVGLSAVQAERLAAKQPNWMVIGKYAVIQADL